MLPEPNETGGSGFVVGRDNLLVYTGREAMASVQWIHAFE